MKDIKEILQALAEGGKLTADQNKKLTEFLAYSENPERVPENKKNEFNEASDLASQMSTAISDYVSSDAYKKAQEDIQKQIKAEKITGTAAEILNLGLSVGGLFTAGNQTRQAERGIRNLQRPNIPVPPGVDPRLDQALVGAERDINVAGARAIGPAQLQIMDQYLKDINTAKTASTGQASNFGALAQLASTRRNRAAQGLVPLAENARQRSIFNRNRLLADVGNQRQADFSNQLANANFLENRYNLDAQALGALGQAGNRNRFTALGNIASTLPSFIPDLANINLDGIFNRSVDIPVSPLSNEFGPEIGDYAQNVQDNLYGRFIKGPHRDLMIN